MRPTLLILVVFSLLAPPNVVVADGWPDTWEFRLIGLDRCGDLCLEGEEKAIDAARAAVPGIKALFLTQSAEIIGWYRRHGQTDPAFPEAGGLVKILRREGLGPEARKRFQGTSAAFTADKEVELLVETYLDPDLTAEDQAETLTHEFAHALQHGRGTRDVPPWRLEGLPEAIALRWTEVREKTYTNQGDIAYDQPLHEPENPYARSDFFLNAAKDLGQGKPEGWLFRLLSLDAAPEGIRELDHVDSWFKSQQGGAPQGLAEYFPRFLQGHALDRNYYRGYYAQPTATLTLLPSALAPQQVTATRMVAPAAADLAGMGVQFQGGWATLEEWDRVLAFRKEILRPSFPEDMRLITQDRIAPMPWVDLELRFAMEPEILMDMVVISNMAAQPSFSQPQTYDLRLTGGRVGFDLPTCVEAGARVPLIADSFLTETEAQRLLAPVLSAKRGEITPDLSYVAPRGYSADQIRLNLGQSEGGGRTLIRDIRLDPRGCMLRMNIGEGVFTYDPDRDYTEFFDRASGNAVYFGRQGIEVWDNGGWLDIPKDARLLIAGGIAGSFAPLMPPLEERPHGMDASAPPATTVIEPMGAEHSLVMMQRFPRLMRESLAKLRRGGPVKILASAKVPCPKDTAQTCRLFRGALGPEFSFSLVEDTGGQLVHLDLNGAQMDFETGSWRLRRPPGW